MMYQKKLKEVIDKHGKWLRGEAGGEWADLRGANLRGANLYEADLRRANLYEADLRRADLSGVDLYRADLRGANLRGVNLYRANLSEANLSEANLSEANLSEANLSEANLRGADLYTFHFQKETLYFTYNGFIKIGCEYHPIEHWLNNYRQIGRANNYSTVQIKVYGLQIKVCAKLQKHFNFKKES